jgi:hypothetical protein
MERKISSQELAQKALELINETDKLEEEHNWNKAIEKYEQAAEYLKQSGYIPHRIADIYNRVAEIKNFLNQEKSYQKQSNEAQLEQAQEQAFALLEGANKLEKDGLLTDALQEYMNAIKLLVNAGWSETQLENLKTKVLNLTQNIEQQKNLQEQQQKIYIQQKAEESIQGADESTLKLKAYERKRQDEEMIQNRAFELIDKANTFEKDKKYDDAIKNYQIAMELLNSIGWTQQTKNLQIVIENIKKNKESIEKLEIGKQEIKITDRLATLERPRESLAEEETKKQKVIEFETKRKREEEIQIKAFNSIDIGKKLEKEKKYDEAVNYFQEAIKFLKSISWDAYIQPITNFITEIKEKQKRKIKEEEIKRKRQEDLSKFQKIILEKQKEVHELTPKEIDLKRKEFEQERLMQSKKEEQFYYILDRADKILMQEKNYDNTIIEYEKAIDLLKNMGPEWKSYISTINSIISNLIEKKKFTDQKQNELKLKKDEQIKKEIEFQKHIEAQIQREQERLKQKEIKFIEREEELKNRQEKKEKAFNFLDTGLEYLAQQDFDKAIYAYQTARSIFAEIQWTDELSIIEEAIIEIENKKKEARLSKYTEMQAFVTKEKKERQFQKYIGDKMSLENEKIKQKQLGLKEREEQKEFIEIKKEKSFKLIEEAEIFMNQNQYNKALELYISAESILNEIRYPTDIIKEMIETLRVKIKENESIKQRNIELKIKNEKESSEFHQKLAERLKKEKERLKLKKVEVEKKEKRKAILEEKRESAFNILEAAKNYTESKNYDQALEYYRKAEIILSELKFPTDSIKAMIVKVMNLKNDMDKAQELEIERELEKVEEERQLELLIEERKRREVEKKRAQQVAIEKRERIIQEKLQHREAAYALLDEAGKYLKRTLPDYDKAISLYFQAKRILAEKVGWEPEIKNLDALIEDLQQEKSDYLEKQRNESQILLKSQQEFEKFKEEMRRKQVDYEKQIEDQKLKLIEFEKRKNVAAQLQEQGLKFIDEAKLKATLKEFNEAHSLFNKAIANFRKIGWDDQVHYIETQIKNIKILEEKSKQEESELQKIKEDLKRKSQIEKLRRNKEEERIKKTISEVGDLSDEISDLTRTREEKLKLTEQQQKEKLKLEAKEFSKSMGKMIRIKQEIISELEKAKEVEKRKKDDIQKEKERKDLNEIARMLREVKKTK